ncbi:hypothetical protein L0F51_03980 [Afifella sp. H1R]|uniref:helix-turn-helix domain-containing protein n=1 Tax=Afifella sp. H1R TaxID=2908841 RepID=UPI001F1C4D2A|nr:helix-turn-helix domain-containing protein [Afifella sp. H1R]MCF1502925.1 hypothetical protein [Afifella sp. H1R]
MSARLLGPAIGADTGTQCRKLVLIKLVDAAEEDGTRIYPSVGTIARAALCSERQVQRVLSEFVEGGLVSIVRRGGARPGDTTEYALNVRRLYFLDQEGWDAFWASRPNASNPNAASDEVADESNAGDDLSAASMGDTMSPMTSAAMGDTEGGVWVTNPASMGDTRCHPTPPDPSNNPSREAREARAGATGSPDQFRDDPPSPAESGPSSRSVSRMGGEEARREAERDGRFRKLVEIWALEDRSVGDPQREGRAWLSLSEAERERAARRGRAYLATQHAAKGRTAICGLSSYLAKRVFERVPDIDEETVAPRIALHPRSQDWWAVFWRRLMAGAEIDPVARRSGRDLAGMMLQAASVSGEKAWVRLTEMPDQAARDRLTKIEAGSAEFRAWSEWVGAQQGVGIRRLSSAGSEVIGKFLWVPAEWPPGCQPKGGETGGGAKSAAGAGKG